MPAKAEKSVDEQLQAELDELRRRLDDREAKVRELEVSRWTLAKRKDEELSRLGTQAKERQAELDRAGKELERMRRLLAKSSKEIDQLHGQRRLVVRERPQGT